MALLWVGYLIALGAVLLSATWVVVLFVAGGRYVRSWQDQPPGDESAYLWVFLVPALNEAVTIADSVARLRTVRATHRIILVIDDGSEDETGAVLDSIAGPDLAVLTRVPPDARKGKAAALNAAVAFLQQQLDEWPADQVIVAIVDADGRLDPAAPGLVARHFEDPLMGGAQANVRIYNRTSYLTRMQGLEFGIFGGLYQAGRSRWGTAFMGGNGQFNRLSALQSVATAEGPWSHYLTEDQELGLRLLEKGWRGCQAIATHVDQQGLNSLRRLYRQRTRWFQGNLQVVRSIGRLRSDHLRRLRRFDAFVTLILPVLQLIVGVAVVTALVLWLGFGLPFLPLDRPWLTAAFVLLAIGPLSLGVLVLTRGRGGVWRALAAAIPYLVYTWVMWPVAFVGLVRHLRGQTTWAKTAREALPAGEPDARA